MDQVIRVGVDEIFGWKRTPKTPAEQEAHDKQVNELMSKNFMDYPACLPKIENEKINLFDGSIPVLRFNDFLENETPKKWNK